MSWSAIIMSVGLKPKLASAAAFASGDNALINHKNKFNGPFGASNTGYALASIDLGQLPTMPNLVGLTAHHAFVAYDPLTLQIDFVSNAVPTRIVP